MIHIEKFWFVILFGLVGLIRTLIAKSEESRKQNRDLPPNASTLPPAAEAESDSERMRKFLEALGQPPGAAPPPKVRPRIQPPQIQTAVEKRTAQSPKSMRRRSVTNPLPPLITRPLVEQRPPPPVVLPEARAASSTVNRANVKIIPDDEYQIGAPAPLADDSFRRSLASPGSLRQAFILREVLGPPRALQPLEAARSA